MIVQKDDISCGAVAIYNALLAFGIKPPSLKVLRKRLNIEKNQGTITGDMLEELTKYVAVRAYKGKKVEHLPSQFILEYKLDDGDMHFAYCSIDDWNTVSIYNDCRNGTFGTMKMTNAQITKLVKEKTTIVYKIIGG